MEQVVLSLGSNVPFVSADGARLEPSDVLTAACEELSHILSDMRVSSVYCTKPMYVTDQADFLNMVVCGGYERTPKELLHETQAIEALFGRNRARERVKGPRPLDIDIALFGRQIVRDAGVSACDETSDGDETNVMDATRAATSGAGDAACTDASNNSDASSDGDSTALADSSHEHADVSVKRDGISPNRDDSFNQPLCIPHPFLNERQYVLIPLLEILPDSADPITERKFSDILSTLPDQGVSLWKRSKQNLKSPR